MRRAPLLVTAILTAISLTAPGARAATNDRLDDVRNDPFSAPSIARALSASATDQSPTAVLEAMLHAQNLDTAPRTVPAGTAPQGAAADIAGPLAKLRAGTDVAEALRKRALAALTPAELEVVMSGFAASAPALTTTAPALTTAGPVVAAPGVRTVIARAGESRTLDEGTAAIRAKIDEPALRVAGLTVLAAIEVATPALRAAAENLATPGGDAQSTSICGVTGDVVFESSDCKIIVGNTGTNGYGPTVDPTILVDLGGNDLYTGGAALATGGVRVLVDLSGDDTYSTSATASVAGTTELVVRGQAVGIGGVAVLADLGGGDTYSVTGTTTAPAPGPVARPVQVMAQGAASTGAGILVDVGGPNTYTADATSDGGAARVFAQGFGIAGLGASIQISSATDRGQVDTRRARATSTLHLVSATSSLSQYTIGSSEVAAQGAGTLGAGILTDAGGSDDYLALATGGVSKTTAQGATAGGAGLLVDAQGDDIMAARALGDTTLQLTTSNPAVCWTLTVSVSVANSDARAQGAGTSGAGALIDGAGNDTRTIDARSRAAAIAEATSNVICGGLGSTSTATATAGSGRAFGQGHGALGAGILIDGTGDDANSLTGTTEAFARAYAVSPGVDTETPTATAAPGTTQGQGYGEVGFGLIADALGADRYTSLASTTKALQTSATSFATIVPGVQLIQGWGATLPGWLLDLDGVDTYSSAPSPTGGAANNKCWSNSPDGRGRDIQLGAALPTTCP